MYVDVITNPELGWDCIICVCAQDAESYRKYFDDSEYEKMTYEEIVSDLEDSGYVITLQELIQGS